MNHQTRSQRQQNTQIAAPVATGLLQRKCACGNHTMAGAHCQECDKKREGLLQRPSVSPRGRGTEGEGEVPSIVHEVLRSPGQPLDPATRAFMEPRFGHDFSQVRVHTDAKAAESARAVNALAYTAGRDVVFGDGQYAPNTSAGQRLIVHELAHVVQRDTHIPSFGRLTIEHSENAYEAEAQAIVDRIMPPHRNVVSLAVARPQLSRDTSSTIRRWKISGNKATANDESDTLGGLAIKVGAHFNDWKCIKPLKMQTFAAGTATESQKKNYERFVQLGDQFDVSNLSIKTGPELKIYLFDEGMDAEIVKKFYPGSVPIKNNPDTDIETAANSGGTPVNSLLIFGHASGDRMWGALGSFQPSGSGENSPEDPVQSFALAEFGLFPRRCWLTRNATVRLVGCDSETIGQNFANAYLRTGASVTTTTRAVGSFCTTMPPGTTRCEHPDALLFAAFSSRNAPIVDGPFTSVGAFHGSKFWKTFKGKL